MYELEYLQTYTGELDPRDLNLAACFNSIEKHCLQGADLEKAAHLLLDRYLLNTPTEK